MQANGYGFQMAAHPCNGGRCDAQSKCMNSLLDTQYTSQNYGPHGNVIKTNSSFTVYTEFIVDENTQKLGKIRTSMWNRWYNHSQKLIMEADCGDYIAKLTESLDGEMVMVMSVGDRNDGQVGFEFDDAPAPTGKCENNYWYWMDVDI